MKILRNILILILTIAGVVYIIVQGTGKMNYSEWTYLMRTKKAILQNYGNETIHVVDHKVVTGPKGIKYHMYKLEQGNSIPATKHEYVSEIDLLERYIHITIYEEITGRWRYLGGSYKFTDNRDSIIWYEQ